MSLYVNRVRYKGGSPTLGASSGIINNAVLNGHDFYDDDYNPTHDYSLDYFTIESLEDGNTITFTNKKGHTMYYSIDNGSSWSSSSGNINVSLQTNGKVMFKCTTSSIFGTAYGQQNNASRFSSTKTSKVYGNIMSILYGDNFVGKNTFPANSNNCWFGNMFYGFNKLTDAADLVLPILDFTNNNGCYSCMFRACSGLISGPELPATTLSENCYDNLFESCTSLVNAASELPANKGTIWGYSGMFMNCSSLRKSPIIRATDISSDVCLYYMFNGARSLNEITCLATSNIGSNATTLWTNNVSSTGTFYKAPSMTRWPRGSAGIPKNWTVQDYVE